VWHWELESLCDELLDVWAADIGSLLNLNNLEDLLGNRYIRITVKEYTQVTREIYLDGPESSTMSGGHILV